MKQQNFAVSLLASFPKSGNTWLRLLLSQILSRNASVNLDSDKIGYNFSSKSLFDETLGIDASELTRHEFRAIQHLIFDWFIQQNDPAWLKVHNVFDPSMFARKPDHAGKIGAVCLVRNPLDIVLSGSNFLKCSTDTMIQLICDNRFAEEPANWWTTSPEGYLEVGTWSRNVTSWLDADFPKVVVRYEDLLLDPVQHFGRILDFLGITPEPDVLMRGIEATQFSKLKAAEDQSEHGFSEAIVRGQRFFRKGQAGDWQGKLSDEQIAYVVSRCGDVMQRCGYLSSDRTPLSHPMQVTL